MSGSGEWEEETVIESGFSVDSKCNLYDDNSNCIYIKNAVHNFKLPPLSPTKLDPCPPLIPKCIVDSFRVNEWIGGEE